jgi:lysozyme
MENKFAESIIRLEEGLRLKPYYCSEGFPTIGFGEKIGNKGDPLPNITTTKEEALVFLRKRISEIIPQLIAHNTIAWNNCNRQQQAILISMAYQVGVSGLLAFKKMWKAIEMKDFKEAGKQMLDSKWATQTRNRAVRHSNTMSSGNLDMYYVYNAGAV